MRSVPAEFVAIGHIAKDLQADGFSLGGSAAYGAVTALRMGLKPIIVTSLDPALDLGDALQGIDLYSVRSSSTTTFRNVYAGGRRTQFVEAVASPIGVSDIPAPARSAPLVMLAPLAGEVSSELAGMFPKATILASLQGWLRRWDGRGRVTPAYWSGEDVLPQVDAAIVSVSDVADPGLIDLWKRMVTVLIVTEGARGASLYVNATKHHVGPFAARQTDPTGAGDVFAAAYLLRYRETEEPLEAARFASCAASFCVGRQGLGGVPTRAQVRSRLAVG